MSEINYPANFLPKPLVKKISYTEKDMIMRSEMESGFFISRKKVTTVPTMFSFSLLLNQEQLDFFEMWFSVVLDYGGNSFNMELPSGVSLNEIHECRFLENPKISLQGTKWNVDLQIDVENLVRS